MAKPNLEVRLQDGVTALLEGDETYDTIANTVPNPHFHAASKLYTRDVLDLVRARLAPGGVYSGWFDSSIDTQGMSIILNTLRHAGEDRRGDGPAPCLRAGCASM